MTNIVIYDLETDSSKTDFLSILEKYSLSKIGLANLTYIFPYFFCNMSIIKR